MSNVKTNWYKSHNKPTRPGVYETRTGPLDKGETRYQRWSGKQWCSYCSAPDLAARANLKSRLRPHPEWRGFTTEQTKGSK